MLQSFYFREAEDSRLSKFMGTFAFAYFKLKLSGTI